MENLDEEAAGKFINALIKSLQTLCHGYLNFHDGIEIIGHINLSVDRGSRLHYILEEKVCKNEENSTLFISNSFFAQNQKSDQKTNGKDPQCKPSGNQAAQRCDSADSEACTVSSAVSSITTALTVLHDKSRSGSSNATKDPDSSHSKHNAGTKRKASEDHCDVRTVKSSHLSSSPSPVSHFLSGSPHVLSDPSSPSDSKLIMGRHHSDTQAESDGGDGDLNLAGSVLECVDDHSNSDLPHRAEDSDGDLEVTFIKEEYVEGEQSSCQYENSAGQQGRGGRHRGTSEKISDSSLYPLHAGVPATFVPGGTHDITAQHYGPSTSSQPQPGTSGAKGLYSQSVSHVGSGISLRPHSSELPARIIAMAAKHTCSFCGYTSSYLNNFKRHMRIHNGQMFHCPVCDLQFNCRWYLQKHIIVKHGDAVSADSPDYRVHLLDGSEIEHSADWVNENSKT